MNTYGTKLPKALRIFALVLMCSCIPGVILLFDVTKDEAFDADFSMFIVVMLALHLAVSIGILSKRHLGFIIFKYYLYLMLLAIPIGTYIAHKTLQYIKDRRIEELYT